MLRIVGIVLFLLFLLFLPSTIWAQTPAPVVNQPPILCTIPGISYFCDLIIQNQRVSLYRKASMPCVPIKGVDENEPCMIGPSSEQSLTDTILKVVAAGNYNFADKTRTPTTGNVSESSTQDWLTSILDYVQFGDDKSRQLLCGVYPNGAGCEYGKMNNAFTSAQCAVLPGGCTTGGGNGVYPTSSVPTIIPGGLTPTPPPVIAGVLNCPNTFAYYSQRDPYFSESTFDNTTIGKEGCGPTAISMILSCYKDSTMNPINTVSTFYPNWPNPYTDIKDHKAKLEQLGFTTDFVFMPETRTPGPLTLSDIQNMRDNYIKNGNGILAAIQVRWPSGWIGHFVWITSIDDTGNVYTMDSWYGWNSNTNSPYPYPMNQNLISNYYPNTSGIIYMSALAFHYAR